MQLCSNLWFTCARIPKTRPACLMYSSKAGEEHGNEAMQIRHITRYCVICFTCVTRARYGGWGKTYLYLFCSKVFLVYHGPPCALEGEDGIAVCCCLCLKGLVLLGFCLRTHRRGTCLRLQLSPTPLGLPTPSKMLLPADLFCPCTIHPRRSGSSR